MAARPWRRWYQQAAWQRARRAQLAREPLCRYCRQAGRVTAAAVVDHTKPHRGDWQLFIDASNHQSLCKPCHDSAKAIEEARGYSPRVGADGWPTDPRHPSNRR